jgi:transcriptional regulator
MYQTPQFEETRIEVMHELIRAHPLATLVTLTGTAGAELDANHIPMLVDAPSAGAPFGTLRGHVARANPLWRDFSAQHGALAVFQGAQTYVTPAWYPEKQASGKVVPTWNYVVVHARGPLLVRDDAAWLLRFVTGFTDINEAGRDRPWRVSDAPPDYIDNMLRQIVGIEMPIRHISGKWKLSQNKTAATREGVVQGLSTAAGENAAAMAALVGKTLVR